MTLRDMTPDELELFDEEIVQGGERHEDHRDEADDRDDPLQDIEPGDEDGLPDGPAKFRVPS